MGKPWMIEQSDVMQDSDTWHTHEFSVKGGDLLLVAFVRLRMMSSEMLDLVFLGRPGSTRNRPETLLKLLNSEISRWETKWYTLFEQGTVFCLKLLPLLQLLIYMPRWRLLALSALSSQVLRLSCSTVAQLLLIARSTQPMQRRHISIKTSAMALLY